MAIKLQKNNVKIAAVFLTEASYLYYRWGALRKVSRLEKNYSTVLAQQKTTLHPEKTSTSGLTRTTINHSNESSLDINTLLKASQTLSGEIVMDKLLEKLMHHMEIKEH